MSKQNDPVQPTPFDVAQPTPEEPPRPQGSGATQGAPAWVLPALAGLLVLAVLVIFWLPSLVDGTGEDTPVVEATESGSAQDTRPGSQPKAPPPASENASPWSDAQAAKLRKEAQDVLAELLDLQFELEERGVEQWAAEEFAATTALAAAGDELYKQREYEQARQQVEQSLAGMQAIEAGIPAAVDARLEAARRAIEDGNRDQAYAALEMAGAMEPENADLAAISARADIMEQWLPLLAQAAEAEQGGDLATAESLLGQAAGIDPEHQRIRSELQRVAGAHQEQRFNDAMSDGYAALDEGQFNRAREQFRRAATINQGSAEAASALQEVTAAETAYRLSSLKRRGTGYESKEQWQEAVKAYEQAREIDSSVLFAQQGLQRSVSRARLDKQFRTALAEPERLSDVAVADALQKLLSQAEKISPRGPVLAGQIDSLQLLLRQASTPVAVTLRSDTETEVIVYKVARLGRFEQRELTLRPGKYTAVGTRNGYRDVRQDFTIRHDSAPDPIMIACTEPI